MAWTVKNGMDRLRKGKIGVGEIKLVDFLFIYLFF